MEFLVATRLSILNRVTFRMPMVTIVTGTIVTLVTSFNCLAVSTQYLSPQIAGSPNNIAQRSEIIREATTYLLLLLSFYIFTLNKGASLLKGLAFISRSNQREFLEKRRDIVVDKRLFEFDGQAMRTRLRGIFRIYRVLLCTRGDGVMKGPGLNKKYKGYLGVGAMAVDFAPFPPL